MNFTLMSPERRRELSQRGGKARAQQFTRESQQFARSHVSRAACQRNGALGAAVTRARYGHEFLHAKWTAWKLTHPTPGERAVMAVLDTHQLGYDREVRFDSSLRTVDFRLHAPHANKIIEVFGAPHVCFADAAARDEDKLRALWSLGFEVLVITHEQIGQTDCLVTAFLTHSVSEPMERAA